MSWFQSHLGSKKAAYVMRRFDKNIKHLLGMELVIVEEWEGWMSNINQWMEKDSTEEHGVEYVNVLEVDVDYPSLEHVNGLLAEVQERGLDTMEKVEAQLCEMYGPREVDNILEMHGDELNKKWCHSRKEEEEAEAKEETGMKKKEGYTDAEEKSEEEVLWSTAKRDELDRETQEESSTLDALTEEVVAYALKKMARNNAVKDRKRDEKGKPGENKTKRGKREQILNQETEKENERAGEMKHVLDIVNTKSSPQSSVRQRKEC